MIVADHERRGVIYLSRIPPFMKPQLLRSLLSKYGEILRIFLTPEGKQSKNNTPCTYTCTYEVWM